MTRAIFLTHPRLLRSEISGGVQLCSQELLKVVANCKSLQVTEFNVGFTRRIKDRVLLKLGLENYSMYDPRVQQEQLLKTIAGENVKIVFINMSSAMRYAKPIKDKFGDGVKVILLSHGNHSGDFLHLINRPIGKQSAWKRFVRMCRLGVLVSTEAAWRIKYLDAVVTISETERQIENWFSAKRTLFIPRFLHTGFLPHDPVPERIGFVGRLDHPPNLQGVGILCDELVKMNTGNMKLRLVGTPKAIGESLAKKYPFIEYLGELPEEDLEKEASTWCFFLNPVWWYSTGASTKLAKGISWGIPIISTTAGMRGYQWSKGELVVADTPADMSRKILDTIKKPDLVKHWAAQTKLVAANGPDLDTLSRQLESICID